MVVGAVCYRGEVVEFADRDAMDEHLECIQAEQDFRRDRAARLWQQRRDREFFRLFFTVIDQRRAA